MREINTNRITNYSFSTTTSITKQNSITIRPSLGIIIGAFYKINSSFILYVEVLPNIFYEIEKTKMITTMTTVYTNSNPTRTETENSPITKKTFGISNFSNSNAMLTLVYRWAK